MGGFGTPTRLGEWGELSSQRGTLQVLKPHYGGTLWEGGNKTPVGGLPQGARFLTTFLGEDEPGGKKAPTGKLFKRILWGTRGEEETLPMRERGNEQH